MFHTVIRRTVKFSDSTVAGEPITTYAATSAGADAYRQLAKEVLARCSTGEPARGRRAVPADRPVPPRRHPVVEDAQPRAEVAAACAADAVSGRVKHDEKMTVYVTSDELLDLEHARLVAAPRRTASRSTAAGSCGPRWRWRWPTSRPTARTARWWSA